MASEPKSFRVYLLTNGTVLILVLVEDGFRGLRFYLSKVVIILVLILVLVEDGFRAPRVAKQMDALLDVLILVLVEDGFRGGMVMMTSTEQMAVLILVLVEDGFRAGEEYVEGEANYSLNPCSCGRWLQRPFNFYYNDFIEVLILVLVEDGFRDLLHKCLRTLLVQVLILVLVEDGFRGVYLLTNGTVNISLNPCSCGRWLQS